MKILLINKFLYSRGGDAIMTLSTGELLHAHGHEVAFWGMKNEKNPSYPQSDLFVDEVDLNAGNGIKQQLKIAGNMLYSLEAKSKVEELIQRIGKPDIVHLHNFAHQISPSVLHVFRKHRLPVVMTMHDYKLVCASYSMLATRKICEACKGGRYYQCFLKACVKDSLEKSFLNTVEMYLHHKILHIYDLIDVLISPSQFLKEKVEEMGWGGKIVRLPNFINVEKYAPKYEWDENSIAYFGRLSKEKGLFTLIEAMRDVPQIELKIIGEGPIKEDLGSRVKELGLKNINFVGYKSGEELKNEIRKSMFVVVPSEWYENNPRSVIEGFALGKPVIGARIGGIPELVVDKETGYTFESGNSLDLQNKIKMLLDQPNSIRVMGKNARQYVERELNSQRHYEKLMKIYELAIAKHC